MTDGDAATGRTKESTFLVTAADADSAVLRDVEDAEVLTLSDHPDLAVGEILEATITAEPPMEVTWVVEALDTRREIDVAESPEQPTALARDLAEGQSVGEVTTRERAGEGEVHVLTVPADRTESAVADVLADEETIARAARLGVERVEIRSADGVVSVRYLP